MHVTREAAAQGAEAVWNITSRVFEAVSTHAHLASWMLTFLAAAIGTYVFSRRRAGGTVNFRDFVGYCFPWRHLKSATTKIDVATYLIMKYAGRYFAGAFQIAMIFAGTALAGHLSASSGMEHLVSPGVAASVLTGLAMLAFKDFGEFFSHYLQHRIPVLWEFHKVHHSATFLTPLTTHRLHPVSVLMDSATMGLLVAVPAGVASWLCGYSFLELTLIAVSAEMIFSVLSLNVLQHSHFPVRFGALERVVVSPAMHQLHHSVKREHWDKNLGVRFSIWDFWFGTLYLPRKGETLEFGLGTVEDERGDYASLAWCLAGPLINTARMTARWIARQNRPKPALAPLEQPAEAVPKDAYG